ncbi:hypothetical protein J4442_05295 [Candidatus Woesearchaeota archaeon]|nr:hypothetical protein [Candidatus Woesearchaeota archaeon]
MINLEELAKFLVRAKKATYAGEGMEATPERPGFKELEFIEGDWIYRDSYVGFFRAPGQEVVRFRGEPVWTMSYDGGMMLDFRDDVAFAGETFSFLKKALLQVPEDAPYRGPKGQLVGGRGWVYENGLSFGSDITDFIGHEKIWAQIGGKSEVVFAQRYIGGLVIPK